MSRNNISKVYSPDIQVYNFDGNSGIFGTLLSLIVGPVRVVSRVMHNIFILPAEFVAEYGKSLLLTAAVLEAIGIIDFLFYNRWPLAVSQLPLFYLSYRFMKYGKKSAEIADEKREVDINLTEVEEKCKEIYDDLNEIVKE